MATGLDRDMDLIIGSNQSYELSPVYHRSFFPFSPAPNSKYVRGRTYILTTLCPAIFSLKPQILSNPRTSMFFII
ncbi:uncharacterized protein N7525_004739 [Penicillium rubens]|uniref:uncharacterized protein n=1 Tax=Penicillium rubens TaxID=1108849 RepID=UPI002A5AFA47|nr:uncharacterized protein N7525_004739 [Penicillium rubens]KAJ5839551.1 hypothetical protein N7525_004739 [Penicillium rubens]KAJ5867548.1 hypothetical protein N7534_002101 [Penicillium rubens]